MQGYTTLVLDTDILLFSLMVTWLVERLCWPVIVFSIIGLTSSVRDLSLPLDIRQLFISSCDYPLVLCITLFGLAINSIVRAIISSERNVARLLLRW